MADRVSSGLRVIGAVALMACFFVVVAMGLHVAARDGSAPESADSGALSFEGATEIGEIEGRRIYRFELEDGTRCLAISGYNGSGLDCDWVPAPTESTER